MSDLLELAAHCIRCGFCLESCPTFVLTGEETESPRGRIYLARSAEEGKISWEQARPHLEACLGCRACETACPSSVYYNSILEQSKVRLEESKTGFAKRALLAASVDPSKLSIQLAIAKALGLKRIPAPLNRILSGQTAEADLPRAEPKVTLPPLDESTLPAPKGEVYLLEGCIMRVLFPRVKQATTRLLRRVGYLVRDVDQGCCGSLHAHNGFLPKAAEFAQGLIRSMPGNLPVLSTSAGCGSTMREYGWIAEDDPQTANAFSARVADISVFLKQNGLIEQLKTAPGYDSSLAYHDACHLAHGQKVTREPRDLLAAIPKATLLDLPESDMCCGSAGIYNILQPAIARRLLDRKADNAQKTKAEFLVMGNPGCHAWIAQAARERKGAFQVLHTVEALEAAFSGLPPFAADSA